NPGGAVHVEHPNDVRVINSRRRASFPEESLLRAGNVHPRRIQQLDSHELLQQQVLAKQHLTHSTFAEFLQNFVLFGKEVAPRLSAQQLPRLKWREHTVANECFRQFDGVGCVSCAVRGKSLRRKQPAALDEREKCLTCLRSWHRARNIWRDWAYTPDT